MINSCEGRHLLDVPSPHFNIILFITAHVQPKIMQNQHQFIEELYNILRWYER